ncbi:MAG: hypothetical protein V3S58_01255 [Nitrosomonadaceae bacterium]
MNHWLPTIRENKIKILAELQQENQRKTRRQKILPILEENPDIQRATYADTKSNPHNVILTIARRHFTTCEMLVSKAKYDPFQLLVLIETQGQETHYIRRNYDSGSNRNQKSQ